jgi:2-polyprenyl-3-methyl-5-hydroxy-6-metoxy-1,4-benzoquinol methylase
MIIAAISLRIVQLNQKKGKPTIVNNTMENDLKKINYTVDRSEMFRYIPSNAKRMLEVGCSTGNFASIVKSYMDIEVWGIEIDALSAEIAKTKMSKVIVNDVKTALKELPDEYFDCIVFNDVLEHLVDPWDILNEIKKHLSKEGVIVASIPNFLEFNNIYKIIRTADWEYQEYGILDNTHLRFFTKKSIIRMFEKCGYSILKIEGINPMATGRKWKLINLITLGRLIDTKYLQFVCVSKPIALKE